MTYKDIITNHQKVVQVFTGDEIEEILDDDNHRQILQFLFKGPLTVEELELAYKQSGNLKSDKSIYRYLGKLKKTGLVIEAGKRIYSDKDNLIKTQTLFSRVAKIIYAPLRRINNQAELESKSFEILNLILKERLDFKNQASLDCLKNNANLITKQKNEALSNFFGKTKNDRLLSLVEEFDVHELYPILDLAGWIILFEEHPEFVKEFIKCYR
ncbi:MAG: winged helix-turn-helix transcriptional regulator [Candidatus Heimdallarchaeota archaeon]|nr:winged helix-turn-helix transcriptional regulator [Candidatus Heimdallarchaeota archaeon]